MADPAHPGEVLREMYLKPMNITVTELADRLKVTRKHVSAITNGRASVTAEMATRLAAALGTTAHYWLNMQTNYDLAHTGPIPRIAPLRQAAA